MINWLVRMLICKARKTPYSHLASVNGDLYMGRFWLVPYRAWNKLSPWRHPLGWFIQLFGVAVRIHHIASPDLDRHMHDHPWSFISVILKGGYVERLPVYQPFPVFYAGDSEEGEVGRNEYRVRGSVRYRSRFCRHTIVSVLPDTWTLFITFKPKQDWGFFTPQGKVLHREYAGENLVVAIDQHKRPSRVAGPRLV